MTTDGEMSEMMAAFHAEMRGLSRRMQARWPDFVMRISLHRACGEEHLVRPDKASEEDVAHLLRAAQALAASMGGEIAFEKLD